MAATVTSDEAGRRWADDDGDGLGREIFPSPYRGESLEAYYASHGHAGLQLRRKNLSTGLLAPDSYGTQPCNLRFLLHLVQEGLPTNSTTMQDTG